MASLWRRTLGASLKSASSASTVQPTTPQDRRLKSPAEESAHGSMQSSVDTGENPTPRSKSPVVGENCGQSGQSSRVVRVSLDTYETTPRSLGEPDGCPQWEDGLFDDCSFDKCSDAMVEKYDVFLSHLQRNGQDAIISMQMFLQQAVPGIKIFIDLDVSMKGDLQGVLRDGVQYCGAFIFFITDGILTSQWCLQEYRWAVQFGKKIVLVRETDARHGGIDMSDFLKQVPADLQESFQNNIAIPWYRQPAFRNISIQEIVQASGVDQMHNVEALNRAQEDLEAEYMGQADPTTACELIAQESWGMRMVFFLGGFATFRNPGLNGLYVIIFNLSYWSCGFLCVANMVYQTVPYHVFSTDALTAYVHLPAWQSWLTWRKFVKSRECDELLTVVTGRPGNKELIGLVCRITGWLVLVVQLAMVMDVLLGFALPYLVRDESTLGAHVGNHEMLMSEEFTFLHSWAMWFIIPPVIAAMFGSYSMFAFIALLHILDANTVRSVLRDCLRDATGRDMERGELDAGSVTPSSLSSSSANDLESDLKRIASQDKILEAVTTLAMKLLERVQQRIDRSCRKLGATWVHLVFFSTCQVLAITTSINEHANGGKQVYTWWWGLQDFFHLGGGIVLLTAAMGIFSAVTVMIHRVRNDTLHVLVKAVSPPQHLNAALAELSNRPLGMHVLGKSLFIDVPKVTGFVCLMGVAVLLQTIDAINAADTA